MYAKGVEQEAKVKSINGKVAAFQKELLDEYEPKFKEYYKKHGTSLLKTNEENTLSSSMSGEIEKFVKNILAEEFGINWEIIEMLRSVKHYERTGKEGMDKTHDILVDELKLQRDQANTFQSMLMEVDKKFGALESVASKVKQACAKEVVGPTARQADLDEPIKDAIFGSVELAAGIMAIALTGTIASPAVAMATLVCSIGIVGIGIGFIAYSGKVAIDRWSAISTASAKESQEIAETVKLAKESVVKSINEVCVMIQDLDDTKPLKNFLEENSKEYEALVKIHNAAKEKGRGD